MLWVILFQHGEWDQCPKRKGNLQCPGCVCAVCLSLSVSFGWLCERNQSYKSWVLSMWIRSPHALPGVALLRNLLLYFINSSPAVTWRVLLSWGQFSVCGRYIHWHRDVSDLGVLHPAMGGEGKWIITLMMFAECTSHCNCFRALCASQQADGAIETKLFPSLYPKQEYSH